MRYDEAVASYDEGLKWHPADIAALYNRGKALHALNQLDAALASYDRVLAVNPDHAHAFDGAASRVMKLCDWDRRQRLATELPAQISTGTAIVSPFVLLGYSDDPAQQLQCAMNYIGSTIPFSPSPLWSGQTKASASNPSTKPDRFRMNKPRVPAERGDPGCLCTASDYFAGICASTAPASLEPSCMAF